MQNKILILIFLGKNGMKRPQKNAKNGICIVDGKKYPTNDKRVFVEYINHRTNRKGIVKETDKHAKYHEYWTIPLERTCVQCNRPFRALYKSRNRCENCAPYYETADNLIHEKRGYKTCYALDYVVKRTGCSRNKLPIERFTLATRGGKWTCINKNVIYVMLKFFG